MIRKVLASDFELVYTLYMHPKINPWLLYEWMDADSFRPIFEDLFENGVIYLFLDKEQPVGMFKLVRYTHRTDHIAYIGGVAIHPDFAGKGYGAAMMKAILGYSREIGLLRLELSTAVTNERAIRLYEKVGFQKEGVLRHYTHLRSEGKFLDEVMMSYLFSKP
jgi:L-phenylalanine/L-methionine N-acetyltransferase